MEPGETETEDMKGDEKVEINEKTAEAVTQGRKTSALLIIDIQYDFCPPDGSLAVTDGEAVIPIINDLRKKYAWDTIALSQDWHPKDHVSFASNNEGSTLFTLQTLPSGAQQMMWPDHCVQGSRGAQFHGTLDQATTDKIVQKGDNREVDSYSAFYDNDHKKKTELAVILKKENIQQVFVTGLAYDYCVGFTALDALEEGFTVYVVEDATRGVAPETTAQRREELLKRGVHLINSSEVEKYLKLKIDSIDTSPPSPTSPVTDPYPLTPINDAKEIAVDVTTPDQDVVASSVGLPWPKLPTPSHFFLFRIIKWIFALIFVPVRFLLLTVGFIFAYFLMKVPLTLSCAKVPLKVEDPPLPYCLSTYLRFVVKFLCRIALFLMGFWWITTKGKPSNKADIIVCNHAGYIEGFVLMYLLGPSVVAKIEVSNMPIIGTLLAALQSLYVYRADPSKRNEIKEMIISRAKSGKFPPILIFPEGTVTNNKQVIKFQKGVFTGGLPVEVISVKMNYKYFSPAWSSGGMVTHLVGMCSQFYNSITVTFVGLHTPTEPEAADPILYAEHIQKKVADASGLIISKLSMYDSPHVKKFKMEKRTSVSMRMFPQEKSDGEGDGEKKKATKKKK